MCQKNTVELSKWQTTDDIYKNLEGYNPTKKGNASIVFHDIIGDMKSNRKLTPTITELFLRGRKLNLNI